MARQTRQQRRERRAQQQPQPSTEGTARARAAARSVEAEPSRPERREREGRGGIPGVRFLQESVAELKKVEWPNQQAVVSGTAVVMIACVIVGAFLWANDEVWKYVVQHVLLR